jgi:hypothetical protein
MPLQFKISGTYTTMGKNSINKRKAKEMQRGIEKLQLELKDEITEVFKASDTPLDIYEIVQNYPDNARKASCDEKTLKQYVAMGLGYMIEKGLVKELPQDANGKWKLALV